MHTQSYNIPGTLGIKDRIAVVRSTRSRTLLIVTVVNLGALVVGGRRADQRSEKGSPIDGVILNFTLARIKM